MSDYPEPDWNPRQDAALDQRAAYDRMRERCPVAFSELLQWSLFRHADVKRTLLDHATFSNRVSRHVSVPNGMDPPEHTAYRRLVEPYFSAERVAAFKPQCQALADELALAALQGPQVELMAAFAEPFAARLQCAFMGWPQALAGPLLSWQKRNSAAVLAADRPALTALALEFEALIAEQLDLRRQSSAHAGDDVTSQLLREKVDGKPLSDAEIASILRNWTVGEVGTIAASIGIIAHFLASNDEVQRQLRDKPELLWKANDEILRLYNPLTDNRRRTTCPVRLGGRDLGADARITINWVAANRDPEAFPDADKFVLDRDQSQNLLYGAGIHVCPGEGLARMELVVVVRALLQHTRTLQLDPADPARNALYPMSGYASLPLRLRV